MGWPGCVGDDTAYMDCAVARDFSCRVEVFDPVRPLRAWIGRSVRIKPCPVASRESLLSFLMTWLIVYKYFVSLISVFILFCNLLAFTNLRSPECATVATR